MAKDRVIGVLNVGNRSSEGKFSRDDSELLSTLANEIGLAIENALLYRRLTEQERMRRELEIASSIQRSLLPQEMPHVKNIDLAVISIPAREVGGDYYDFVSVGRDRWGVVIGDVSGKSIPAAIYMAMVRSILRAQAMGKTSASDVLAGVNSLVSEDVKTIGNTMFVTMFYGILDAPTRTFIYTNAGHNSPILYRPTEKKYGLLKTGGMVVGVVGDYRYQQSKVQLAVGDTIVFYTDGITEAKNPKGEMLGEDSLRRMITRYGDLDAGEIKDRIYEDLLNFTNGAPQHDDLTLVVLKSEG
jgi:sigma-B regulation protein RsbU (phosphoserine phosphatase)